MVGKKRLYVPELWLSSRRPKPGGPLVCGGVRSRELRVKSGLLPAPAGGVSGGLSPLEIVLPPPRRVGDNLAARYIFL